MGRLFFRWKGFIFKWRGAPWASVLVGGGLKKIVRMEKGAPSCPSTMGNPEIWQFLQSSFCKFSIIGLVSGLKFSLLHKLSFCLILVLKLS